MKAEKSYNVILADDHILVRDALANLIAGFLKFNVVATAANGTEVVEILERGEQTDIVLTDLIMPEMDGFRTAQYIKKRFPKIKTVILSMHDSEMALIRLLQIGIQGFLKKDIHPAELNNALLVIAKGEFYYSQETAIRIANLLRLKAEKNLSVGELLLDEQEIEFLKLVATDMTYPEIARKMRLTTRHIENYRQRLFAKLQVDSRVGLAIYAVKNGIISV